VRGTTSTAATLTIVAFLAGSAGSSRGEVPNANPETLQALCDAGGTAGPDACYRLALLYHDAKGVPRDTDRARQLAVRACRPNAQYRVSYQACFTAFLWGGETWPLLGNPREMWVSVREVVQAPDLERRKQLVATSRDLTALRELLDPAYDEIRAIPDYPALRETVKARVTEIARSDADWVKRRFCVVDMTLSGALPSGLIAELAQSDPQPEVRAAAAEHQAQAGVGGPGEMLETARSATDPSARLAALSWVTDRAAVTRIAEKDPDPGVRSAAVERLFSLAKPETQAETDAALLRIAEKDKDHGVRIVAVAGIKDEKALARLARKSPVAEVRASAVEKTTDQLVVAWAAEHDTDYETRLTAIRRVTDQAVLQRIATSRGSGARDRPEAAQVRAAAVSRLRDQRLLADLAIGEQSEGVWVAAIQAMTDQSLLLEVAQRRPEEKVAEKVGGRLSDPSAQRSFLKSQVDPMARLNAASRITDPALAAEVATTDSAATVRRMAVTKMTDQALLLRIAEGDVEAMVRGEAASRLTDPKVQLELERTTRNPEVRYAIAKIRVGDPAEALRYARTASEAGIRLLAVTSLTDQAVLAQLARNDPDGAVRIAAIRRLTDHGVLIEIAGAPVRDDIRSAAAQRLRELGKRP
jgi:hypothetical protein